MEYGKHNNRFVLDAIKNPEGESSYKNTTDSTSKFGVLKWGLRDGIERIEYLL